ncbi:MAG: hypothetical protein ACRD9L_16985, partial [Bryobacteraceae bacterium]
IPEEVCARTATVRPAADFGCAACWWIGGLPARGLGHVLISEAFRISLRAADEAGCRCIVTDAYRDRISWYTRYGFVPIEGAADGSPQRMFLDIRTVRAALRP